MEDTQVDLVPSRAQRHARRRALGSLIRLPEGRPRTRLNPWLAGGVAAALVVLGGVALETFRAAREGTLPNLELDGVPVGSLDEARLRVAVERVAAERASRQITITRSPTDVYPATSMTVPVEETGYRVDVDATVEAFLGRGRQWNPVAALVDHLRATLGAVSAEPVDIFDQERLTSWVRSASSRLSVQPREGSLAFEGITVAPVDPAPGARVAEDDLRAAVQAAAPDTLFEAFSVDTEPVPPRTTPEDVREVLAEARRALAGPVSLTRSGESLDFTPEKIARALGTEVFVVGQEVRLRLVGDPEGLDVGRKALRRIETGPVDASFKVSGGAVRVVRSRRGFLFDPLVAAEQLVAAALSEDRRAKLTGERVDPELTTEEARELSIDEQVSTFTTYHGCCEPRVTNIHRMADLLDGNVVLPGEILSVNQVVGERTEENGFVKAPAIREGEFVEEVGGGISQFATTMFNAIFFGGYDFIEYKAHSYYFERYPIGQEATVSWPSPDLEFRNDSRSGIFIDTSYTDTSITVTFYGNTNVEVESVTGEPTNYRDPKVECEENPKLAKDEVEVVQEGDVGFDVVVERVFNFADGGSEVERFFTHYRAEPRIEQHRSCD